MDLVRIRSEEDDDGFVDTYIGLDAIDWKRIKLLQGMMRFGIIDGELSVGDPTDNLLIHFLIKVGIKNAFTTILSEYKYEVSDKK